MNAGKRVTYGLRKESPLA